MSFLLGVDVTNKKRFTKLAFNEKFINKILTENEIKVFNSLSEARKITFISKRFAGKEAFSKALGCGIGGKFQNNTFTFKSIEILNNAQGAPFINLLEEYLKKEISNSLISFSDEEDIVFCAIILSKF